MQLTGVQQPLPFTASALQPLIGEVQRLQPNMTNAACTCDGGKWADDRLTMTSNNLSQSIFCGKEYAIKCKAEYVVTGKFLCGTPDCVVSKYYVETTDPSGGISTAIITNASLNYIFATTLNGTYQVSISPVCGDKVCTPCTINFVSSGCDVVTPTCECGEWKSLALKTPATATAAATALAVKCDSIYDIKCSQNYTFFAEYACKGTNCGASYKATMTLPNGLTYNLLSSAVGSLSHTFTPIINGDYVVNITPICGTKTCPPCKITFRVKNCTAAAACTCGKWESMTMQTGVSATGTPNAATAIQCNGQYKANCNKPVTIAGKYACVATTGTVCEAKYNAYLLSPTGVNTPIAPTTGTFGYTFTPTMNGNYILVIQPACGDVKCEPCKITISISDCNSCACGKWESMTLKNTTTATAAPVAMTCGSAYELSCKKAYNIAALFKCDGVCAAQYTATLYSPTGAPVILPIASGAFNYNFTPPANGTYSLIIVPQCGTTKCTPCRINFTVKDCVATNCVCGDWKSLNYKKNGGISSLLKKDTTYNFACNDIFSIIGQYKCKGTDCAVKYDAKLTYPDGTSEKMIINDSIFKPSFTLTGNGLCFLDVTPICGTERCQTYTFKFNTKGCSEASTCKCGKWATLKAVTNATATTAAKTEDIVCGGTYSANCGETKIVKALYLCDATNCQARYISYLVSPNGTTSQLPESSGYLDFSFKPASNGTYTLVIQPICGDVKCEPCKINFVVSNCTPNCVCGKWSSFTWGIAGVAPTDLVCNKEYVAKCKQTYNIAAQYQCVGDSTCNAKYNAYMITPAGTTTVIPTSSALFKYAFTPTANGVYTLVIEPTCGSNKCEPCKIRFIVSDCVNTPTCTCGKWASFTWGLAGAAPTDLVCGKEYIANCKKTYNIAAQYQCVGDANCTPKYNAYMLSPSGLSTPIPVTGSTLNYSFTPTADGIYTLVVEPICGTNKCEPCRITFIVKDCVATPTCTCGKWASLKWGLAGTTTTTDLVCGKAYIASCKKIYNITGQYQCVGDANCAVQYNAYLITPTGNSIPIPVPAISGNTFAYPFAPTTNGTYTLVIEPTCGSAKCTPCKMTFIVKDCVNTPTCTCGKWASFKGGVAGAITNDLICGNVYDAKCTQTFNIAAQYQCVGDAACTAKYNAYLISPTGASTIVATSATSLNYAFTPTANGLYSLVVEPVCGTLKCTPCRVAFRVQDCGAVAVPLIDCCKDTKFEPTTSTLTYKNGVSHTLSLNGFTLAGINPTDIASLTASIVSAKTSSATCKQNGVAAATIASVLTNTSGLSTVTLAPLSREVTFTGSGFTTSGNISLALDIPLLKDCVDILEVCVRFEVKKANCSACVFYKCLKIARKYTPPIAANVTTK
jgi:hypothetical protein